VLPPAWGRAATPLVGRAGAAVRQQATDRHGTVDKKRADGKSLLKPRMRTCAMSITTAASPQRGAGNPKAARPGSSALPRQLRQYYGYLELPNPGAETLAPYRRIYVTSRSGKHPPGERPGTPADDCQPDRRDLPPSWSEDGPARRSGRRKSTAAAS